MNCAHRAFWIAYCSYQSAVYAQYHRIKVVSIATSHKTKIHIYAPYCRSLQEMIKKISSLEEQFVSLNMFFPHNTSITSLTILKITSFPSPSLKYSNSMTLQKWSISKVSFLDPRCLQLYWKVNSQSMCTGGFGFPHHTFFSLIFDHNCLSSKLRVPKILLIHPRFSVQF